MPYALHQIQTFLNYHHDTSFKTNEALFTGVQFVTIYPIGWPTLSNGKAMNKKNKKSLFVAQLVPQNNFPSKEKFGRKK